jgi:hypothetical protein
MENLRRALPEKLLLFLTPLQHVDDHGSKARWTCECKCFRLAGILVSLNLDFLILRSRMSMYS